MRWIFFLVMISVSGVIEAEEFQNFEIKDSLKWKAWIKGENSNLNLGSLNRKRDKTPAPGIPPRMIKYGPIYQEILSYFGQHHKSIVERELERKGRDLTFLGGLNHVGLSYSRPFASFSIQFQRLIAPDLFEKEKFIVTDVMNIYIDATQLLGNLKKEGILDISEEKLLAFAGLVLKRSYQYTHFANSYKEALTRELNNLFFVFRHFQFNNLFQLAPYHVVKREDLWGVLGGGLAGLPVAPNLAVGLGKVSRYYQLVETQMRSLGSEDERRNREEGFRLSFKTSKVLEKGVQISLLADFFKLIRIGLLGANFNYSLANSYKVYLSFDREDINQMEEGRGMAEEVRNLLKQKIPDLKKLASHIIREERMREQSFKDKYYLLFSGSFKNRSVEYREIAAKGKIKEFFRHKFEKNYYRERLFSRLKSVIVNSFIPFFGKKVQKGHLSSQGLKVEYQSSEDLIKSKKNFILGQQDEKWIKFNFFREAYTHKNKGLVKGHKKLIPELLRNFSSVNPLILAKLEEGILKAPLHFKTDFSFSRRGLDYFNNLSPQEVFHKIDRLCLRKESFDRCRLKLYRNYHHYLEEQLDDSIKGKEYRHCLDDIIQWIANGDDLSIQRKKEGWSKCLQSISGNSKIRVLKKIPLWRLRFFLQNLHREARNKWDIYDFFGQDNVLMKGRFQAVNERGGAFIHSFREGPRKRRRMTDGEIDRP